jgi:Flp pilus assembly protein TadD
LPADAEVLTTLGAARIRCGEHADAVTTLERAIALGGRFPVRQNALLAMALQQSDRSAEARAALERARELMADRWNSLDRENRLLVQQAEAWVEG